MTFSVRAVVLSVAGVLCACTSAAQQRGSIHQGPVANLAGLWGIERVFRPEAQGELTIVREGATWTAQIAGFGAPVVVRDGSVTFALTGGKGEFRGRFSANSRTITGHWIQPKGLLILNRRYASPVELRAIRRNVWRGLVTPLDDQLSLYLWVEPRTDGSLEAMFRNPELNFRGGARSFRILLDGNRVTLVDRNRDTNRIEGTYDPGADRLSLLLPTLGGHVDLTRRARDQARGFYPASHTSRRYIYRAPIPEDDGWPTASLSEVGLREAPVSSLVQSIMDTDPSNPDAALVQGLLIARHGKLVLEEYFYGFHKELTHDLRSASKSFTSLMIGIALDRGNRFSVTTPVYSLFPEYASFANADSRKQDMTLEHLLTMSSGLACDDNDESSPGNEDRMYDQTAQPDWYKYTLDLPMSFPPGEKAVYCTAGVNLLGGILRTATKDWLPDFFRRQLAVPLQIRRYYMNLMPTGEAYMGGGMRLRPRDALKTGQVFLAGGTWNGRRIISKEWIARSTAKHSTINPESSYGYNWWLHDLRSPDGRVFPAYAAEGNGGQLLIIIPNLDLVVMFTGGNYNRYPIWRKFRDELTPQFIVAAVSGN